MWAHIATLVANWGSAIQAKSRHIMTVDALFAHSAMRKA